MYNNTIEGRHSFYMSKEWRNLRVLILMREPLCRLCKKNGLFVEGADCDHILPISTHPELRLDSDNIQVLCKKCHSQKTYDEVKDKIKDNRDKSISQPKLKWKT